MFEALADGSPDVAGDSGVGPWGSMTITFVPAERSWSCVGLDPNGFRSRLDRTRHRTAQALTLDRRRAGPVRNRCPPRRERQVLFQAASYGVLKCQSQLSQNPAVRAIAGRKHPHTSRWYPERAPKSDPRTVDRGSFRSVELIGARVEAGRITGLRHDRARLDARSPNFDDTAIGSGRGSGPTSCDSRERAR